MKRKAPLRQHGTKHFQTKTHSALFVIFCQLIMSAHLISRRTNRAVIQCALCAKPKNWAWRIQNHSKVYPDIWKLAEQILHIPATSVPAEWVFSVASNVISKKRANLAPDNANVLVSLVSSFETEIDGLTV